MRQRTLTMACMVAVGVLVGGVVVRAQKPGEAKGRPLLQIVSQPAVPASPGVQVGTPPLPEASPSPFPPAAEAPPALPAANEQPIPDVAPPTVDPMEDVDAFLDQNRKRAAESIQKLSKEANELRARLRKVEMALQRWQTLSAALDRSAGVQSSPAVHPPMVIPPTELAPAPIERAPASTPLDPTEIPPPNRTSE